VLPVLLLMLLFELAASPQTAERGLYVATYLDVESGSTNEGIAVIKQYSEDARSGKGNTGVDVVQEIGRPNHFVIVEAWRDQSSFDAHEQEQYNVRFRSRLKSIHNSPYDQRVHQGLAIDPRSWPSGRDKVSVVTHIDVPPPQREEAEVLLRTLAEQSRKDGGNLRYDVLQQTAPRTNHFTVVAVWQDRKAFESHEMKPHTRQSRERLGPMLGAPYDERLYQVLK
jgi:quinol monooxygenase YgiN